MLCQFASSAAATAFLLKYMKASPDSKDSNALLPWVLQTSTKYWDEIQSESILILPG